MPLLLPAVASASLYEVQLDFSTILQNDADVSITVYGSINGAGFTDTSPTTGDTYTLQTENDFIEVLITGNAYSTSPTNTVGRSEAHVALTVSALDYFQFDPFIFGTSSGVEATGLDAYSQVVSSMTRNGADILTWDSVLSDTFAGGGYMSFWFEHGDVLADLPTTSDDMRIASTNIAWAFDEGAANYESYIRVQRGQIYLLAMVGSKGTDLFVGHYSKHVRVDRK